MKYAMIMILLLTAGNAWAAEPALPETGAQQRVALQGMQSLRIVLSKLTETVKANKDLDQLKSLGMPDPEVARLKRALELKLKQLTDEALYAISLL